MEDVWAPVDLQEVEEEGLPLLTGHHLLPSLDNTHLFTFPIYIIF